MRPERLSSPKHPAQKPVSILKKIIRIASNENDIIFDPFMGVGSMGVAALELGRRFIGVELDSEYFDAAKKRIDNVLNEQNVTMATDDRQMAAHKEGTAIVHEPLLYGYGECTGLKDFFTRKKMSEHMKKTSYTGLQPILKWPGGKEKELKHIIPNAPRFKRYFEPFVGGGSVFMGIEAEEYYINDFSSELIDLYHCIASSDEKFFSLVEKMDEAWTNVRAFFVNHHELVETYIKYRQEEISKDVLKETIHTFCSDNKNELLGTLGKEFLQYPCVLVKEAETNLFRKMVRMHTLEQEKHLLPLDDLNDNVETALKSAVYMNYRNMYNNSDIAKNAPVLHCALFFFMRNYAYSGMFRYSGKGDFNVPYGGIAYNGKLLGKKLKYYHSEQLLSHFGKTKIYNLDFADFLRTVCPDEDDFIFLDPPYDSEFSTYAQNSFTREDQERLAAYLQNECRAKWMLVIKNTDFIYGLYHKKGLNIRTFDKEYLVSFMNRNDKKVTHLLITNY